MNADQIIKKLKLVPLPGEGGYYRETFRSKANVAAPWLPENYNREHNLATCIYYLITPDSFSEMHKLPTEEIWHFYLGDPAGQLQILPDGTVKKLTIGNNIADGQMLQLIVPAGAWQGTRLAEGGKFALFGTTMSPGFEFSDYIPGELETLLKAYPAHRDEISKYFH
jgi:uncharacterized protein